MIDTQNYSTAYIAIHKLVTIWVFDYIMDDGSLVIPLCRHMLLILLEACWGSANLCGLDDVFPLDNFSFGPETQVCWHIYFVS